MRYVITVVCSIVLVSSLVMCGSKKMQHKSSFSNFEITTSYHRPLYCNMKKAEYMVDISINFEKTNGGKPVSGLRKKWEEGATTFT